MHVASSRFQALERRFHDSAFMNSPADKPVARSSSREARPMDSTCGAGPTSALIIATAFVASSSATTYVMQPPSGEDETLTIRPYFIVPLCPPRCRGRCTPCILVQHESPENLGAPTKWLCAQEMAVRSEWIGDRSRLRLSCDEQPGVCGD